MATCKDCGKERDNVKAYLLEKDISGSDHEWWMLTTFAEISNQTVSAYLSNR